MIKYQVLRIFLAAILGLIMGGLSSRVRIRGRDRGSRTFALVAASSALVAIISSDFFKALGNSMTGDPGRLSAQVIAAMGFIGTGLIWASEDGQIRGLSVSASLWLTAIMGLLVGSGLQHVSTAVVFIVLVIYWITGLIGRKRGGKDYE